MESSREEIFSCPYCGSENSILVDFTGHTRQKLLHDCEICCRPIVISVKMQGSEIVDFHVQPENE